MDALDIFDLAHAQETELRDLTDNALLARVRLAGFDHDQARRQLEDLRKKIDGIETAHGQGAVPDKLRVDEMTQAQAVNLANLRLGGAQAEQTRRREAAEQAAAQHAAADRAQRLNELRASAWAQYQADMGTRLDGVSLADPAAFDARWAAYLADLALGRAELLES